MHNLIAALDNLVKVVVEGVPHPKVLVNAMARWERAHSAFMQSLSKG